MSGSGSLCKKNPRSQLSRIPGGISSRRDSTPSASSPSDSVSSKKSKHSKSESDKSDAFVRQNDSIEIDVSSNQSWPSLCSDHRAKDRCPCDRSIKSAWKLDCVECGQWWHADCVGLKGISQKAIGTLTDYHCPYCYVSPVPTITTAVNVCHICRNTLTLQQSNLDIEAKLAHEKINHMAKCCNILGNIDFEQFSKNLGILGQFDAHLKHILLKENFLKGLDSKIQGLNELLISEGGLKHHQDRIIEIEEHLKKLTEDRTTNENSITALSDQTQQLTELVQKLSCQSPSIVSSSSESSERFLESISHSMEALQSEVHQLKSTSAKSPTSASAHTDKLLQDISEKLDKLCSNEPDISAGLNDLKQSIQSIQSAPPPPLLPPVYPPSSQQPPPSPSPEPVPHGQSPVSDPIPEFVTDSEAQQITEFLTTCSFKTEKSHSVVSFGVPYDYTGAKSASDVPPIPEELQPLFDKVNELQKKLYHDQYPEHTKMRQPPPPPTINSCLVNKYEGTTSYLPKHSDKEVTIHPESSIFTLSIGQQCEIKFTEQASGLEFSHLCEDRSLYHMTRRSQEIFSHSIDKESISELRFSLTFRSVNWRNRNSTCLIGDSNTGNLRFGSCKKSTFGELMPGQRFWAPKIKDIDPRVCMGYTNVVILCGINDIKGTDVQCEHVAEIYSDLKSKIKQILRLNPKCHISLCRLLPTKNGALNQKVILFNRLIYTDLLRACSGVRVVDGFQKFADYRNLLSGELSKTYDQRGFPDLLHLNKFGVRILASLIKHSIFIRIHGGIDKRRRNGRIDGRLYSDASRNGPSNPPAPRR